MRAGILVRPVVPALLALAVLAGCSGSPSDGAPVSPTPASPESSTSATGTPDLVASTLAVPDRLAESPFDTRRTVFAPEGWTVELWARVDGARIALWTPDGRLLVSRPDSGDVRVLTPRGEGAPEATTLVGDLRRPHGLAFDGDTLYVAESHRVLAFRYADGAVSDRRVVVDGLPDDSTDELQGAYAHALKTLALGADGELYITVGSTGNVSPEDREASPERASILRVPAGGGEAETFARGVRNGTALAVDPDGALWTAVNNRDRIAYPYRRAYGDGGGSDYGSVLQEYVNDHPLEPVARLTEGRDLGWPYCNPDPDVDPGAPDSPLDYSDRPSVRDVETNPDGERLDCAALPEVEQGFPAHSAPLGMSFTGAQSLPDPWGEGALVGVHGSWNRQPPRAPEVSFLPWRDGTLGAPRTLLGGFQLDDGSRWGRPVAAVIGPDGDVWVTDDQAGAVYRMVPAP